jgi:hypothetical protein
MCLNPLPSSRAPLPHPNHLQAAVQSYPITKYQPVYFVADSMADAKERMRRYCETLRRPFHVRYDAATQSVSVDRAVVRGQYTVTLQTGNYA